MAKFQIRKWYFLPISQFFTICEIVKVRENRLCCVVIVMHAQKIKLCCVVKLCFFTITTSQFHKFTILFYNSDLYWQLERKLPGYSHRDHDCLLFLSKSLGLQYFLVAKQEEQSRHHDLHKCQLLLDKIFDHNLRKVLVFLSKEFFAERPLQDW